MNSENLSAFVLDLAELSRGGSMVDSLRIKSFSYYYVPLLLQAERTFLLDPNFDDESFDGEGKILQKYLNFQAEGIFWVDKSLGDVVEKLPNFALNKTRRQVVGGIKATRGSSVFEFLPNLEDGQFDHLFRGSFYNGGISSTSDIRKNIPYWKELIGPRIRKNGSVFMSFLALGQQLAIFGPEKGISKMRARAKELSCEWSAIQKFFDDV